MAALSLIDIYVALNRIDLALEYSKIYINIREGILNEEKNESLVEMEARFQSEQMLQQIDNQRIILDNQQLELDAKRIGAARQRLVRNSLIAAIVVMLLIVTLVYRGYVSKIRMSRLIEEKNVILQQANAEIMAQRDEIESQRDRLFEQNEKLMDFQSHISNSLLYAQSIQLALLPSDALMQSISPNYFTFIKPCEMISGDFFWGAKVGEYSLLAIADCTGHGVPGAFMSILGINALNDVVVKYRITHTGSILGYLRDNVVNTLSQNDTQQLHKDGMDIAICSFNEKNRELQFSGAKLPLWLVLPMGEDVVRLGNVLNQAPLLHAGYALFELKGDTMPVGISPKFKPFSSIAITLPTNSTLYLSTDGFYDQFGGFNNSRYGKLKLKKFIAENASLSMPDQREALSRDFSAWKGLTYQVDDVAVLGIRL